MVNRKAAGKGVWFRVKHLVSAIELWLGTFHFTPGCNQIVYSEEVTGFLNKKPKDGLPVIVQGDANADVGWGCTEGQQMMAVGRECNSTLLLNSLAEHLLCPTAPLPAHRDLPTSRPRQAGRQGHHIDLFATSRVFTSEVKIYQDSCLVSGTDHELVHGRFRLRKGKGFIRHRTGPRVWKGELRKVDFVDQSTLEELASKHTQPRPGRAYRDPEHVKGLFRQAKLSKTRQAWKLALAGRSEARRQWEMGRLQRALDGDWLAYREASRQCLAGWELGFAEAQIRDPHVVMHTHLSGIYEGPELPDLPVLQGSFQAFSVDELQLALGQLKRGKSVGIDLTSTELLQALVLVEGGRQHLLEFLNRTLVSQAVPPAWNKPLIILLPKVGHPTNPREVRPIALGSSISKLFARMVTNRIAKQLEHRSHAQCAGRHRQPSDVMFSLCRLFQLEQEWKRGLVAVKIDISKAFDSVNRRMLLSRLRGRLGDTIEYRALRALLVNTEATLQSAWGTSSFLMGSGIKQGAIESPMLFSFLMDVALSDTSRAKGWERRDKLFADLTCEELLFMDDGVLWGLNCQSLGTRLAEFASTLQEYGLELNLGKCRLYCSPWYRGLPEMAVATTRIHAQPHLEVMGVKFRVGAPVTELIQPLLARARSKFWSVKHLLRCNASVGSRTRLMNKVVTNSAMWCIAAFPPDVNALKLVNAYQNMLMGWLLKLGKRRDEGWVDFRRRLVRSSRAALHNSRTSRWSTGWLEKWWNYAGHRVRGLLHDFPPVSSLLEDFRTLSWWRAQQSHPRGERHPGQFYPRLTMLETRMDKACQGPWRACALDRQRWKALGKVWIQQEDLPWCSGLQLSVMDEDRSQG